VHILHDGIIVQGFDSLELDLEGPVRHSQIQSAGQLLAETLQKKRSIPPSTGTHPLYQIWELDPHIVLCPRIYFCSKPLCRVDFRFLSLFSLFFRGGADRSILQNGVYTRVRPGQEDV